MPAFKALIENSPDAIALLSPLGEVLYASPSTAKLFGYLPEELVGRNTFDLLHPEDRGHSLQAVREVILRPPGPRQLEVRILQKNGKWCWVESTISNLLDEPSIAAILLNCREISARKAAREQKQLQSEELVRANVELEDFAYGLAHDLREPLRTISMYSEVLVTDKTLDELRRQEIAQFITNGVQRMSALLDGLHALAIRAFDYSLQPVDLWPVVAEALQNLGAAISSSDAIVTVDPLPRVQGDPKQLLRVFQNLLLNAIKYRSEASPKIHVTAQRLGLDWIIRVQDNGIGIAKDYHDRVFRLLQRLHGPETSGAGIGLAICKKIVEAHGGTIWVESELAAGSTFCFTVAATKEQSAFSAPPGNPEDVSAQSTYPRLRSAAAQGIAQKRKGASC